MMRIERKSTLTPVSGCLSPGLLCVEVVDRKLNDHIALGENLRTILSCDSDLSAATTAIASTRVSTISPTSSDNRVSKKQKPRYPHCQEIRDSIASRLPARSQSTIHRRLRTAIAQHLPPRTANRATYKRMMGGKYPFVADAIIIRPCSLRRAARVPTAVPTESTLHEHTA